MGRILLVDDEDCVLRSTALVLESEGHSTVCVLNGQEAENLLKSQDFDVMVTDIRMAPVDGMQLIMVSREMKPRMPIIVISAFGSEKTAQQTRRMGACAYIKKPFTVDHLLATINGALAGKLA